MDKKIQPFGERLKEERARLGLSQPALGEIAGATKWTVINWEKGDSSPDAVQLGALAEKGLDVLYVVTGAHTATLRTGSGHGAAEPVQSSREGALLDAFRQLEEPERKVAEQMIKSLAASRGRQ